MTSKKWIVPSIVLAALALLAVATAQAGSLAQQPEPQGELAPQAPLGAAFTYQGQLKSGGEPVTGDCDVAFRLYDDATADSQVGSAITATVPISDGLFTVSLDFGSGVFAGDERWLGIEVQCPGDAGYTDLGRQALTAAPYALYALNVAEHEHWGESWTGSGTGLYLDSSDGIGLRIDGAGTDGVYVVSADYGLHVQSVNADGVYVSSADGYGVSVGSAGYDGVYVYSADDDGVSVYSAGNPGTTYPSTDHNGFEVAGAEGNGLYVGQADGDGVSVYSAGNPSTVYPSTNHNGFEVAGAERDGLYVGWAGDDGVHVMSAVDDGVYVFSAGGDGVHVESAGGDGVHVESADGYAGYFKGEVEVDGDLTVSDQLEVNGPAVGFFPRPTWDSGWVSVAQDETKILTHNVGGNPSDYFVDFQCLDGGSGGINIHGYGLIDNDGNYLGAYYKELTSSAVLVRRWLDDVMCDSVRVRIWHIR
jgi:hypothetical protein